MESIRVFYLYKSFREWTQPSKFVLYACLPSGLSCWPCVLGFSTNDLKWWWWYNLFLFFFSFTGLYTYHVFPAVLERQEAFIFRNPIKPDPWQQGSWPTLGTRHLLSQWQEIICAWGHSEKSNDKAASWWNCPLWTTVNTFLLPCFMSLVCFLVLKMGRWERSKEESGLHA